MRVDLRKLRFVPTARSAGNFSRSYNTFIGKFGNLNELTAHNPDKALIVRDAVRTNLNQL